MFSFLHFSICSSSYPSSPFNRPRQLFNILSVLLFSPFVCLCWFCFTDTIAVGGDDVKAATFCFRLERWCSFSSLSFTASSLWFGFVKAINSWSSPNSLFSLEWLLLWFVLLMVELLPLWIEDLRMLEMFCASLRSLWEGRIGIGVAAAGVVEEADKDEEATGGKGGGGPVGDVGTGCVIGLPTAGFCREFIDMSPLLGNECGTSGTEPIGGWWKWCDG